MLPYSLPSSVSAFGRRQMKAYPYTPKAGDVAWVNYIPVKFVSDNYQEGTYNQKGFVAIDILSSNTGKQAWVDYVPVVIDDTRTDAWLVNRVGYIPVNYSGTGDGTAANKGLSLNFVGASTLDPRITFSRASNATVTGSNGLIQYAPHNLMLYSEQFDNSAWTKSNANITVTANTAIAPNGTTTADTATISTGGTDSRVLQTVIVANNSDVYTVSFYAKRVASEAQIRYDLRFTGGSSTLNYACYFDWATFTTGSVFGASTPISTSATSVGNGWYRIVVVAANNSTGNTSSSLQIYPSASASGTVINTGSAYLWGAQLNVGSLQPYYPTTVKNLVGYSEAFDNAAWTKAGSSISATKVTAPNGALLGQKLVEDTTTAVHTVSNTAFSVESGKAYSVSIYAKAAERSFLHIRGMGIGSGGGAVFNLSTGVIQQVAGYSSAFIESVGNGWYRCTAIGTAASSGTNANPNFGCSIVGGTSFSYTGDGTSGIYIWGAQMADATSVVPYVNNPVAAPTAAAYYGARFDYDPVTLQPKGLLIEEQRTNLLLRSQNYAATWIQSNVTPTYNTTETTSPSGDSDATKFVIGGSIGALLQSMVSTAVSHTGSVYLKVPSGTTTVDLVMYRNSPFGVVATKTVTVTTAWQRFDVTGTFFDTTSHNFQINFGTNKTVYVWGAQVEAGAFATSYIPTTSAQVTRSADIASIDGSNFSGFYNQSEGTIFGEVFNPNGLVLFGTGDTFNNTQYFTKATATNVSYRSGGADQAVLSASVTTGIIKAAMAYKVNDFAAVTNGGTVSTDTSGAVPVGQVRLKLGSSAWDALGGNNINGHIRRIAYYPRRLTNQELQGITA